MCTTDRPAGAEAKQLEQILRHGRAILVGELGAETFETLQTWAQREVAALAPTAPRYTQATNRANFSFGIPVLAIYRSLRRAGLDQDAAVGLMHRVVDNRVEQLLASSRLMRLALTLVGHSRLLAAVAERVFAAASEPHGWLASRPAKWDAGGAHLAVDIDHCGMVRYLAEQGAPELCPVFCDADLIMARHMGLRLERTEYLSRGGVRCSFRFFHR